jgi:hypothetical protein
MSVIPAIFLLGCFTAIVWQYWEQLMGEEIATGRRWFWLWYLKGVATPIGIWILFGAGGLPGLPSLLGQTQPGILGSALEASAVGIIVISSYWAAVTVGWLLVTLAGRIPDENLSRWRQQMLVWSVPLLLVGGLFVHVAGWKWAGLIATLCLLPLAHGTMPFLVVEKVIPQYAAAVGKMKLGRFDDAEWEIIRQLEECEDDFQGWMMLAELYACHFHDLPGAVQTVRELCNQPNITPSDVGVAMHKLADWHLKLADDPYAARQALEEICRRYPGSHLDRMARMRIEQIPATPEALRASRTPRVIALPNSKVIKDSAPEAPERGLTREDAIALMNDCVARLQTEPNDVVTRERFARLLAERLSRPDLAIEQVELLIAMAEQPPARQAGWLRLMADWQLRILRDTDAGCRTLRTLVEDFAGTPEAFEAQRRLMVIELESRWRRTQTAQRPQSNDT